MTKLLDLHDDVQATLLDIFFKNLPENPTIDEQNQHLSRKECLYVIRTMIQELSKSELETEGYPATLEVVEGLTDEEFEALKQEVLEVEFTDDWSQFEDWLKKTSS
ncbi:hypothetical protein STRDD10_00406 [Streptococcus sp. DD10]|uniref:hypothetical protein n=1 Tax=Streptococcus sp. DD10 TaxID=1777878 RepID=UPI000797ABAB|nr:hypothetical protein [Streptococcus sp. DD10]KXT75170.1 hypothetical protein STRDD10_00406 [Streptococcus sp. DD10]